MSKDKNLNLVLQFLASFFSHFLMNSTCMGKMIFITFLVNIQWFLFKPLKHFIIHTLTRFFSGSRNEIYHNLTTQLCRAIRYCLFDTILAYKILN